MGIGKRTMLPAAAHQRGQDRMGVHPQVSGNVAAVRHLGMDGAGQCEEQGRLERDDLQRRGPRERPAGGFDQVTQAVTGTDPSSGNFDVASAFTLGHLWVVPTRSAGWEP